MAYRVGDIRHLVFHVYPDNHNNGALWKRSIDELRKRISSFNGRRWLGVSTGPKTHTLADVELYCAGMGCRFLEVQNIPSLREGATLVPLYEQVSDCVAHGDVTFHGHSKGVTSEGWASGSRRWADALFESCLDYWPLIQSLLEKHPIVGPFKRYYTDWKTRSFTSKSTWHFSGAFRWFRNADMFERNWRHIEPFWCASESHPSMVFSADEAAGLICEIRDKGRALYDAPFWDRIAQPALNTFRTYHAAQKRSPLLLTCVLTSHRKLAYVEQAICSVINQTSPDWSLVVLDSGECVRDLAHYTRDARIRIVDTGEREEQRKATCMQSWAINEAFLRGMVTGDLVTYLCDDDLYEKNAFASFLKAAREHPEQHAWCGTAARVSVSADGTAKVLGVLGNYPMGTVLDCKVDGMQVCHRLGVRVPWPEGKADAWHADGMFLRLLAGKTPIHPVDVLVGWHRHTPVSTFTRSRS